MSRFDWSYVHKRASTWLGMLTTAQGGMAIAWGSAPHEWREAFPSWMGTALLGGMMITGALTPFATSLKQKGARPPEQSP